MSMLPLPAPDASALDWGICAASIPGWRFPWECAHDRDDVPESPQRGQAFIDGKWVLSEDLRSVKDHVPVPDPDHWMWDGWFLRLLGNEWGAYHYPPSSHPSHTPYEVCFEGLDWRQPPRLTLGRACIAAAAALGRWPGIEG